MKTLPVEKDTVLKRINGIELELAELEKLGVLAYADFVKARGFELGQYHLHRALEGVFNISAHILSRIPGGQATRYKDMAQNLGKFGIVEQSFAAQELSHMADYRNRLVHFYAEVTSEEVYEIIKGHLGDFETFLRAVKFVLEHPEQFGLTIEYPQN
jgi:uncharacterized protein YutE (UPF0331/DUF86 family)